MSGYFDSVEDYRVVPPESYAGKYMLTDYDGERIANIFKSLEIDGVFLRDIGNFSIYEVKKQDTWDLISNKVYGMPDLWWILCTVNGIENPFSELIPEQKIKILKKAVVDEVLYLLERARLE